MRCQLRYFGDPGRLIFVPPEDSCMNSALAAMTSKGALDVQDGKVERSVLIKQTQVISCLYRHEENLLQAEKKLYPLEKEILVKSKIWNAKFHLLLR